MKQKTSNAIPNRRKSENTENDAPEGYPLYPETEDIYGKYHKERWINPEDPTKTKEPFDEAGKLVYQKAFRKGLAWIPAGHILRMSPPLIMDEKYASMGMDIIEDAIADVEKEFGYK